MIRENLHFSRSHPAMLWSSLWTSVWANISIIMNILRITSAVINQKRWWGSRIPYTLWRKSRPSSILISNSTSRRMNRSKIKSLSSFGTVSNSTWSRSESRSMSQIPKITWSLNIEAPTQEGSSDFYNANTATVAKCSENGTTSSTTWGSTPTRSHTNASSRDATSVSRRKPTWTSTWKSTKERRGSNATTAVAGFSPSSI